MKEKPQVDAKAKKKIITIKSISGLNVGEVEGATAPSRYPRWNI